MPSEGEAQEREEWLKIKGTGFSDEFNGILVLYVLNTICTGRGAREGGLAQYQSHRLSSLMVCVCVRGGGGGGGGGGVGFFFVFDYNNQKKKKKTPPPPPPTDTHTHTHTINLVRNQRREGGREVERERARGHVYCT
jgi:hypothetical protein